jgi:hypothetical protein
MTKTYSLINAICILCVSFITSFSIAQNASGYAFTAVGGTYNALSSGTTNVSVHTASSDDAISNAINLGFTFKFAGVDYSQIKVSSNGWLTFNTAITVAEPLNAWIEMNNQRPTLFPLWDNLQNRVIPRYRVDGTAPNRIFKLEWSQSEWNFNSNGNTISFQVWLYETSNVIEYIYNQGGTAVNAGSASIGIFDHNGKHLALNNSGTSPTALNTILTTNISTKPANGQIYRFTPPLFNSQFISFNTGAQVWCPGETRSVSVTVKNAGTTTWTNSAPDINIGVKWNSDPSYTIKANANGLTYGSTGVYSFNVTAPSVAGFHYLIFDVINETAGCEFGNNLGTCRADNAAFISDPIVVKEFPPVSAGADLAICGGSTTLNGSSSGVFDPVVLFNENFEAITSGDLPTTGTSWKFAVQGPTPAEPMKWQVKASCDPVIGSNCLNMHDGLGTDCDYRWTSNAINSIAFRGTAINAAGMTNLKLSFRWKAGGSVGNDYGRVCYSTNGTTWTDLPTNYTGQINWTTAFNVALPAALNNTSFYIGFRWINDAIGSANSAAPGFCIDDILVLGNSPVPQPVTVSWSPAATLSNASIVNPVATPLSTTTYTLTANSSGCTTSDQVTITVDSPSTAPTSVTGTGAYCIGNTVSLTQSGGALAGSANYNWYSGSCGGTLVGTGPTITVSPTATTSYYVRASSNGACPATTCASGAITMPPMTTNLSGNNESATCLVTGSNWVHFYHSSGRYIGSIHPQGEDLGMVDMTSFVGSVPDVDACGYIGNPLYKTAVMDRHWVVTPDFQPTLGNIVDVQLPFTTVELADLSNSSLVNANNNDDVNIIEEVVLSRYHGPLNVNEFASDNCAALGGNENTVIHSQTDSDPLNSLGGIFAGYSNTQYTRYSIPQFSELWLHGSSNISPLPATFTSFSAFCDDEQSHINIQWSTASEINTSHFTIEKSVNGVSWSILGTVQAAGTSSINHNYSLIDENRISETMYYRILQVDKDGNFEQIGPISVNCVTDELGFEVFPNPTNDEVSILFKKSLDEMSFLTFEDLNGKEVKRINFADHTSQLINIDVTDLADGVYIIRLVDSSSKDQMVRLVKN